VQIGDVGQGRAFLAHERAHDDDHGGEQQEQAHVNQEWKRTDPMKRETAAALSRAARRLDVRITGSDQPMALDQLSLRYALAAAAWSSLMKTGVPFTGGSAAAAVASTLPAAVMAA